MKRKGADLLPEDWLPPGTRVKLKVPATFGAIPVGTKGTILHGGVAIRDGCSETCCGTVEALRDQWAVLCDQSPNPEHADAVAPFLNMDSP